jgi:glycosyltransferase involved in cell wall biosynthesis
MRVLHFYKNALPLSFGGVEQLIDQIATGTQHLGVQNTVLTLNGSSNSYSSVFHQYRLLTCKRDFVISSNDISWKVINVFKEISSQVDLIHYHFPWPFADLVNELVSHNKPTVLTYHSDIVRQKILYKLYKPLMKKFLTSVDHIIATSPNYFDTSKILQSFKHKVSIIPIGLDSKSYDSPKIDLVNFYKEHFGNRFFLFIGALRYYKGLEFILEAAERINYPIVIIGSGPLDEKLKAISHHNRLKNVFFTGITSEENKCALLEASYGLIFPSHLRSEAFGISLLEGAMFSKPLISCEIGTGTSYVNIHNETGLVIPPSNSEALANAMNWLWIHPQDALRMGRGARKRYEMLFTAEKMSQSYFELYNKVINNCKKQCLITDDQKT